MAWTYATTFPPFIKLATIITILRLLVFILNRRTRISGKTFLQIATSSFALLL